MKIHTCALKPFETSGSFFTRDSGLLCMSLQAIGVESKVVIPEFPDRTSESNAHVIRAKPEELASAGWWKGLGIDGVAFITWGHAEDTPVIRAARDSGIRVVLVTDDGEGRRVRLRELFTDSWRRLYHESLPRRAFETMVKFPLLYPWMVWRKYGRYGQYELAHLLTCWTERIARNVKEGMAARKSSRVPQIMTGFPASAMDQLPGDTPIPGKPPEIIAAARWSALKHKRPHFLMDACRQILAGHPTVLIHIYGSPIPMMEESLRGLPESERGRVTFHGFSDNRRMLERMSGCEVAICPSVNDCGPIPMAEALCCGCTVVGGGNVAQWAAETGFGTPVPDDKPESFARAVIDELAKWDQGVYDRRTNAARWREHFSVIRFAENIRDFVAAFPAPVEASGNHAPETPKQSTSH